LAACSAWSRRRRRSRSRFDIALGVTLNGPKDVNRLSPPGLWFRGSVLAALVVALPRPPG